MPGGWFTIDPKDLPAEVLAFARAKFDGKIRCLCQFNRVVSVE